VGSLGCSEGVLVERVGSLHCSVGVLGVSVGSLDCSVGVLGARVGSLGCSVGVLGERVGSLGCSVGVLGERVGSLGCSVGVLGVSVGSLDCSAESSDTKNLANIKVFSVVSAKLRYKTSGLQMANTYSEISFFSCNRAENTLSFPANLLPMPQHISVANRDGNKIFQKDFYRRYICKLFFLFSCLHK